MVVFLPMQLLMTKWSLPLEKDMILHKTDAQTVHACMQENKIDNRTIYYILDQICKDTDLHPYVKQHESKRDSRGVFYATHSRWLVLNHVNATASEAEVVLQMLTYNREKNAWNWEKYVAWHVKYHNNLGNLMEYGYQGLDTGLKVTYLLNGIRCDKLSTAVTAVRAHSDKYKKDLDSVVTFLTQYIDKRAPTLSVKVASVMQTRPAKWHKTNASYGTFKGKIELKKYTQEEYESMSTAQHQQLHNLQKKNWAH